MNPLEGKRVLIEDPAKLKFSPNGWHEVRSTSYTTVRGNNGIAQENWDAGSDFLNNKRADGGESLDFSFRYSPSITDATRYIDAATTQVFYTCNVYHDLLDSLGFTERAGNFEEVNTGKGGKGGDAVQLNAQDGSGINNANFITPPDGVRPRMVCSTNDCICSSIYTNSMYRECTFGVVDLSVMVILTKASSSMNTLMG